VILVDSSVWVEYDRATGSPAHLRLKGLIEDDGPVAVTEPVIMEVLAGACDDRRENDLRRLLGRFEMLSFDAVSDFDGAVRIYRRCRGAGITPRGMLDCMIAAVAWRRGAMLLAHDADMDRVARVIGIELDEASLRVSPEATVLPSAATWRTAQRRRIVPAGTMPSRSGLLGLGSNVGERRANLQSAVDALPGIGVRPVAASSVYDTDPVGEVLEQPSFLNACLLVETALDPLELLSAVKRLEAELGRAADGVRHGPRAIDIDILLLGDIELTHAQITLPHEQLLCRRFVLVPALELDFELATPDGRRLSDALAVLGVGGTSGEGVRWAGPPLA
jgi:2-amino-4-hydroxy-6-hydroxymethyldihydropteridine diphosphokinase